MEFFEMAKMVAAPDVYFAQEKIKKQVASQNHHAAYSSDAADAMLAAMNSDLAIRIMKGE
jgi:hypothetical protein